MKLSLAKPELLKESVRILSGLINEGQFKLTNNGLELIAMDPANVSMVILKILNSAFTEYHLEKDETINLNLLTLKEVLNRSKSDDLLLLETEPGKLRLQLKGKNIRTFSLPLIELAEKEQKVPDLTCSVDITLPCEIFNSAIEDAGIVADSLALSAEPAKFDIIAEGDLSEVKIEITANEDIKINTTANAKSKYSIVYLKRIILASKLTDIVNIRFSKDYPLLMEYKKIDEFDFRFILAPRVDND